MGRLLEAEINAGRIQLKGGELLLAGQKVKPQLMFEVAEPVSGTSGPSSTKLQGAGVRLGQEPARTEDEDVMTQKFASLPPERLLRKRAGTAAGERMVQLCAAAR